VCLFITSEDVQREWRTQVLALTLFRETTTISAGALDLGALGALDLGALGALGFGCIGFGCIGCIGVHWDLDALDLGALGALSLGALGALGFGCIGSALGALDLGALSLGALSLGALDQRGCIGPRNRRMLRKMLS